MFNNLFGEKKEKKTNVDKNDLKKLDDEKNLFDKSTANKNDLSKLEEKINQEKEEIKKILFQIGIKYYEEYKDEPNEYLVPLCNVVDESNRVIIMCEQQINYINGVQICPNCGAKLSLDAKFCDQCGYNLLATDKKEDSEEIKQVENTEIIRCRECGTEILDDSVYCANCGAKVR